ncbi:hypothetical protein NERG_02246 [Nematocida ausubeli]|uniref:Trimethylguanosine synthase n=1 Tax=Nematocida ausubeli (strain ATCC PRA-371 / ERTm2) TaxID=1913371 RepID=H8ZF75_NEMA1|nr:hypothetical protein NERG_02246 [Nematocida ausubeli]
MFYNQCRVIRRKLGRWSVYDYTGSFHPELYKYMKNTSTLLPWTANNSFLLDSESWFSITPADLAERISVGIKNKFGGPAKILDLFSGVGGNTISFLRHKNIVHSVEIDYKKIRCLQNNIRECTTSPNSRILHFSVYDPALLQHLDTGYDVLMASPPWGGIEYKKISDAELFKLCRVMELEEIYRKTTRLRIYMLPRHISDEVFNVLNDRFLVFSGVSHKNRVVAKIIAVGDITGFHL